MQLCHMLLNKDLVWYGELHGHMQRLVGQPEQYQSNHWSVLSAKLYSEVDGKNGRNWLKMSRTRRQNPNMKGGKSMSRCTHQNLDQDQ